MLVTNHLVELIITYAESLRLLVLIFGDPVVRESYRRQNENETKVAIALTFALLRQERALDSIINLLQVLRLQTQQLVSVPLSKLVATLGARFTVATQRILFNVTCAVCLDVLLRLQQLLLILKSNLSSVSVHRLAARSKSFLLVDLLSLLGISDPLILLVDFLLCHR